MHSFAYRALGRPQLVAGKEKEWNGLPGVPPAWRLPAASSTADDPLADAKAPTAEHERYHLLRATAVPRDRWPVATRQFAARYEAWKVDADLLDFDDLIETAAREVMRCPGNPRRIYVDECQDSSKLLLSLARVWGAAASELVLVGDPRQSIYRFAGAYPQMFYSDKIDETTVLGQSYRVPVAVHAAAQKWATRLSDYHEIEYRPRDAAGETGRIRGSWKTPERIVRFLEDEADAGRTAMLQAPCAYMLGPTLKLLRARGTPFSNRWRRKNGAWNPLAPRRGTSVTDRIRALYRGDGTWTMEDFAAWAGRLATRRALNHGAKAQIAREAAKDPERLLDLPDLLRWLAPAYLSAWSELPDDDPVALGRWWQSGLDTKTQRVAGFPLRVRAARGPDALETEPAITVGTTHSLKGSEADTVVVIPDLSHAGWREWTGTPDARDEIVRLGYVAMTRARERLFIAHSAGGTAIPLGSCCNGRVV